MPLSTGADDRHDATSVYSRTARCPRRASTAGASAQRTLVSSPSRPHSPAVLVPLRDDLLPLSCRDSNLTPPRADGDIPSRDMTSVPFDSDADALALPGHRLSFSLNNIVIPHTSGVQPCGTNLTPSGGVTCSRTTIVSLRVDNLWSKNDVRFPLSPIKGVLYLIW